jgi:hypothetical protein
LTLTASRIIEEFRGLRWMPLQPKHLDYPNAQLLIIGESRGLDHATEALDMDQRHGKETPLEEMEKLEGEDEIRVKHLKGKRPHQHCSRQDANSGVGDDAIFADLGLSSKEYPKVLTTW